jgi:hypothetical protein
MWSWPALLCLTDPVARHTLQSRGIRQRLNDMTKARTKQSPECRANESQFLPIERTYEEPNVSLI